VDNPCVFLKMTTQGWDLAVLRGAERRLRDVRGLHTELSLYPIYDEAVTFDDALHKLNRAGFVVSGLLDRPHHRDFRLAEIDCVMTRPPDGIRPLVRRL
jgi:hypothetical protein